MILLIEKSILEKIPYKEEKIKELLQSYIFRNIPYDAEIVDFKFTSTIYEPRFDIVYKLNTSKNKEETYNAGIILNKEKERSLY